MGQKTLILLLVISVTSGCSWNRHDLATASAAQMGSNVSAPAVAASTPSPQPTLSQKMAQFRSESSEFLGYTLMMPVAIPLGLITVIGAGGNPWR